MPHRALGAIAEIIIVLSATRAFAASGEVIAVFDIEDGRESKERLAPKRLANLSDYLATLLAKGQTYQLVPSADIRRALIAEKKESYQSCYDEACQIEIGKAVAAQKSVRTSIIRVGDQCVLQSSIYDLAREVTDKVAHFKGECDERSLVAAIELVVSELKGEKRELARDASGNAIHFDTSTVGRMGELRPPTVPPTVAAIDFGDVDLAELERFDLAVKGESDASLTSEQKLARWIAASKTKKFRTVAVERVAAWKAYIEEEKAVKAAEKRLAAQRTKDWKKLEKLLGMTVIDEKDKVAWVDAFLRAYGSDPAKNPVLAEKTLQGFLAERAWKTALEQSKAAADLSAKTAPIYEFMKAFVAHNPRRSAAEARLAELDALHRRAIDQERRCFEDCRESDRECRRNVTTSCHGASGYANCLEAQRAAAANCRYRAQVCPEDCKATFAAALYGK